MHASKYSPYNIATIINLDVALDYYQDNELLHRIASFVEVYYYDDITRKACHL